MVAKATTTAASPFAPSHTDESPWSKIKTKGDRTEEKEKGEGRENSQEKLDETTIAHTKRKGRRAYQARRPPARPVARARSGRCFAKH